ncbi:MAG: MATE family efflux transporter [Caulobacteraceae bacterium]
MINKKVLKNIILLSYPLILENLLQVSMGLFDNYFVSKLGTEEIAGVGITNLIMNIYMSVFYAIGVGTTAMVSRHLGAGENENASESAQQAYILSVALGLVIGVINLVFYKQILMLLGLDASLLSAASPYFLVVAGPSVLLSMTIMISSSLRGAKDTKSTMKIAVVSNIVNIVLDPILIFGIFNIPGMGIIGAGIATSFSRLVGVILLMRKTSSADSKIKINYGNIFKFDKIIMMNITKIGIPVATERLFMRVGQLVYYSYIIALGTKVYAAYIVSGTLESFAYIPGIGIGGAAAALIGTSLGAKENEEAYRYGMGSLLVGTIFMVSIGIINFIFAPAIADIFTKDAVVKANIIYILRVTVLYEPFTAITLIITPALQGAGDTRVPMIFTLVGIWLFRVLGCYLLVYRMGYGISAVIFTVFLDIFLRSILLIVRYRRRKWQYIKVY